MIVGIQDDRDLSMRPELDPDRNRSVAFERYSNLVHEPINPSLADDPVIMHPRGFRAHVGSGSLPSPLRETAAASDRSARRDFDVRASNFRID